MKAKSKFLLTLLEEQADNILLHQKRAAPPDKTPFPVESETPPSKRRKHVVTRIRQPKVVPA